MLAGMFPVSCSIFCKIIAQNGLNKVNDMMSLTKTSFFQGQDRPRDLEINQEGYPVIVNVRVIFVPYTWIKF